MCDSKQAQEELSSAQSQIADCHHQADVLDQQITALEKKIDQQENAVIEFDKIVNQINDYRAEKLRRVSMVKEHMGVLRAAESYVEFMEELLLGREGNMVMESLGVVRGRMGREITKNDEELGGLKSQLSQTQDEITNLEFKIRRLNAEESNTQQAKGH